MNIIYHATRNENTFIDMSEVKIIASKRGK